ncbi:hypothetical protein RHI9324_05433 [Rhizobium sp. CECT 9324]|nr:hypothetical protein RHI9324_05433 [Rhizobium sp. CECT 9324]
MIDHATEMREIVRQNVGIPTCVGIGTDKDLGEIRELYCQEKSRFHGVADLTNTDIAAFTMERTGRFRGLGRWRGTTTKLARSA